MITPRSFRPDGLVLEHTHAVMLREHPEAFDCIIWPAKDASHDEILSVEAPEITLLDSDERAQQYEAPILSRAMIIPDHNLQFGATDSGLYESFNSATEAIRLLLSEPVRKHSIVQWLEWLDLHGEECVERTVYVARVQPLGKTLNCGNIYVCFPLLARGEKPDTLPEQPETSEETPAGATVCPETPQEVGMI